MEAESGVEKEEEEVGAFFRASSEGSFGSGDEESLERLRRRTEGHWPIRLMMFSPSTPSNSPIQSFTSLSSSKYKRRDGTSRWGSSLCFPRRRFHHDKRLLSSLASPGSVHQYWAVRVRCPPAPWFFRSTTCPLTCAVMSVSVQRSLGSRMTRLSLPSELIWALQRGGSGSWVPVLKVVEEEKEGEDRRWMNEALISCSEGSVSSLYCTVKV